MVLDSAQRRSHLNRLFYHTFKGGLFVRLGGGRTTQRFSANPHAHKQTYEAAGQERMKPPRDLVPQLATLPSVLDLGGAKGFYPGFLATSLAKTFNTKVLWNGGGIIACGHSLASREHSCDPTAR